MALADSNASVVLVHHMDDASGNAIATVGGDLTDNGSVGTGTAKLGTGSRDFESGSSQYFSATDQTWNSFGNIDVSISFWVQFESLGVSRSLVFKENGSTGDYYIYVHGVTSVIRSGANYDGNADVNATTFGAVSTGVWYLVVWKYNAATDTLSISVNTTANTRSYSSGINDAADIFRVGNDFYNNFHDGLIDELIIWKGYCLSSADETELYNGGTGLAYPFASAGATRGTPFGNRGTAFNGGRCLQGIIR
jgi:hypothetical protein